MSSPSAVRRRSVKRCSSRKGARQSPPRAKGERSDYHDEKVKDYLRPLSEIIKDKHAISDLQDH
eukprot:8123706-Karenia_brevis.AAC.1